MCGVGSVLVLYEEIDLLLRKFVGNQFSYTALCGCHS